MNNKIIKHTYFPIIMNALLIIVLYFVGFNFKDYVPGGSPEDFSEFIWKNLNSFQNDFANSLLNYGEMADANFPGFYVLSYFNPFAYSIKSFHLFSLFLGFLTFISFGYLLSKKDPNNLILNYSLASLILILPFFISRVYWGTSAGLGWLIFIFLLFYFNKIQDFFSKNKFIYKIDIFILCFLSSLLLYLRASFIFFALYIVLYFFLIVKKKNLNILILIFFSLFSVPGIYLINLWSGQSAGGINALNFLKLKNIFLNFPILTSFFSFYFFPILVVGLKNINKYKLYHYSKIFFLIFSIYVILYALGKFEYLASYNFGGGAILKLNYIISEGNYLLLLLSSIFGCCLLYNFLEKNFFKNIILILPIFLVYGLTDIPYQDYFEPLLLFLFFAGMFQSSLYDLFVSNKKLCFYLYFLYLFPYLNISIYIKNFY